MHWCMETSGGSGAEDRIDEVDKKTVGCSLGAVISEGWSMPRRAVLWVIQIFHHSTHVYREPLKIIRDRL